MPRKKSSPFEDLITIAAMLPWWLGVLLALASYLLLHHFAAPAVAPSPANVTDLGAFAQRALVSSLCSILQYILPIAFLIGAGISAWKAAHAKSLLTAARANASNGDERLAGFSWQEFESIVGQAFRERGFTVEDRGGRGPDGGIDLVLRMGKDKYLVQCKHWKAQAVGVVVVRELFGVMTAEGAVGGFLVASGAFTAEAAKFAEGRSIELVDARKLISNDRELAKSAGVPSKADGFIRPVTEVACPRCGGVMVKRVARQGANAGSAFWGCASYPKCRGIVPIATSHMA